MTNVLDILMYHSISDRGGPTSIGPDIFAAQMEALSASSCDVISMDDVVNGELEGHKVVITFDDAFEDFATNALPVLDRFSFPATVYVPTNRVGADEDWTGAMTPPRPLMSWETLRSLPADLVTLANHTLSHPDLTTLPPEDAQREIVVAKETLETQLNRPIRHFAAPYGKVSESVKTIIAQHHDTAVGTRLDSATGRPDIHDLPRLEMFYFQSQTAWTAHLNGRGGPYLAARRGLRALRNMISHPAERQGGRA